MTTVNQAFRFELDPSDRTRSALASHCGASRFAFNWGLALIEDHLAATSAFRVLALRQSATGEQAAAYARAMLGPVPWSLPALRRRWNAAKDVVAPWWSENSKEAYSSGLDALARALANYFDAKSGRRKATMGFPKRKKHHARRSCRFSTGAIKVTDHHHVQLPRLGVIRTKEPTGALLGRLATGSARVLSATISEEAGRWFVSFTCGVERHDRPASHPETVVGVDLGVHHLAALSSGEIIDNPKAVNRYQRRIARLGRELSRRTKGSKGRVRTKAALARCLGSLLVNPIALSLPGLTRHSDARFPQPPLLNARRAKRVGRGVISMCIAMVIGSGLVGCSTAAPSSISSTFRIEALSCPSVTWCAATGFTSTKPAGLVLVGESSNGGTTWNTTQLWSKARVQMTSVSCPIKDRCVALVWFESKGPFPFVYILHGSRSVKNVRAPANFQALTCPTESRCFAEAITTTVFRSDDGGLSWMRVVSAQEGSSFFRTISCQSASRCLVPGSPNMTSTDDGGESWSTTKSQRKFLGSTRVSCASKSMCVLAGGVVNTATHGPAVTFSRTGGNTWTPASLPATIHSTLFDVSCSADTCVATATTPERPEPNAVPVYSKDGGSTWIRGTTIEGVTVPTVRCVSGTTCVANNAHARGPVSVVTHDGGETWTK